MYQKFQQHLTKELQEIRDAGLYKNERIIASPQAAGIKVENTPAKCSISVPTII